VKSSESFPPILAGSANAGDEPLPESSLITPLAFAGSGYTGEFGTGFDRIANRPVARTMRKNI
jgi:hypothetical protein